MGVKVQVIFYSLYGHVYQLAKAVAEGASLVEGADVEILQIRESFSDEILTKMGALEAKKSFAHVPIADAKRLAEADVILLGSGTRYGGATAQMRAFLDETGKLWSLGTLIGKVGGAFTSTGSQHGGQETTLVSLHSFFLHMGMVVTGVPYSAQELLTIDGVSGGTPYGASTITGSNGERMASDNELLIARFQGRHATSIGQKLIRT